MKTLDTDRLRLRAWNTDDAQDLFAYASSPLVGPNAGWEPHASIDVTKEYLEQTIKDGDTWAIVLKETGHAIGSVGLHATRVDSVREIGYVMHPDFWGHGYMTEAVKAVLRFAFEELGLSGVRVKHYPFNTRSKNVILRCGFQFDGTLRMETQRYDGVVLDACVYSMTREEWERDASSHPARGTEQP